MARKQIVHWPRPSAESHAVWSSTSDGALRVILRHSPELGWSRIRPSSLVDRFLPFAAMAMAVISGVIIGWALFVP
ncbi:MAG TPA: hypothetical protein VE915_02385 [Actinomycetota bacterium]|jgi:hypothetical protein|nr:hypothetical protein [Actinomycetota bacterium]